MGSGGTIAQDAETPRASLRTTQGKRYPFAGLNKDFREACSSINVVLSWFYSRCHSFMTLLFLSRECSRAKASRGIPE